jgi:hypothetical protein
LQQLQYFFVKAKTVIIKQQEKNAFLSQTRTNTGQAPRAI